MTRVATDGQYCQLSPGPGPLDGPSLVLLCHLVAFRRYHVSDRHNSYGIPLRTSPVGTPFPRQGQRSWWYCGLCPTEEEGGAGPARDPLALSSPPPPPLPTRPGVPTRASPCHLRLCRVLCAAVALGPHGRLRTARFSSPGLSAVKVMRMSPGSPLPLTGPLARSVVTRAPVQPRGASTI